MVVHAGSLWIKSPERLECVLGPKRLEGVLGIALFIAQASP